MIRIPRWVVAAPLIIAGCVSPTIGGCTAIAPSALPDGAPALQARIAREATGAEVATWGQGASEVRQVARRLDAGEAESCAGMAIIFAGDCYPRDAAPQIRIRGGAAVMLSAGDSLGDHRFDWVENGCVYEIRMAAGMPSQVAIDYAARY